jgi:mannose-6-phosphate isomerase-like protein (cupin superfamily)
VDAGLEPVRVSGAIMLRGNPFEVDDTLVYLRKPLREQHRQGASRSAGPTFMATEHISSAGRREQIIDSPARQGSFVIAGEDLTITHARYAAGEHVAGRHIHRRHTDAFYVLEGDLIFEMGREAETITVSAGGFVAAPPGLAHAFRVADSGPASWLTIHAPDGGFAAFMRGLRDGIEVEWDIAPVPADGGLPADYAIISLPD